jgi:hypothetical protein
MGQATRTILIVVKNSGIDQTNNALKSMATTSQTAAKSTDALGSSWQRTGAIGTKTTGTFTKFDSTARKTTATTNQFGAATDKAGSKVQGFAQKFQGNRGAIFAFIGMGTAGIEAIGMYGMYVSAADKVAEAQDRVNVLARLGQQETSAYSDATSDLAEAKRGLGFVLRNMVLSFGDLIPFMLLSVNAMLKMKTTVDSVIPSANAAGTAIQGLGTKASTAASTGVTAVGTATTAVAQHLDDFDLSIRNAGIGTDDFGRATGVVVPELTKMGSTVQDNTKFIGTKGSGMVGGISALSLGMEQSTKTSTKFRTAFTQIGDHFKSIPNVLKGVGSSIAGFFTNFTGSMTKFGGVLKTAGVAAMGFSKTLLLAFLSNPITAAIAAISAAILALATDFGGIRTAINNFGVAVGNAIPALKGILQAISGVANGALDYVANLLGVKKSTDDAGNSAIQASPKFVQLTTAIKDSQTLGPIFDGLRKQVAGLTQQTEEYTNKSIIGYEQVYTAADAALTPQQKQIPEVSKVMKELADATTEEAVKGKELGDVQANLNSILTKLQTALIGQSVKQNAANVAQMGGVKIANEAAASTTHLSQETIALGTAMAIEAAQGKNVGVTLSENNKALKEWLSSNGIAIKDTEALTAADNKLLNELRAVAPALQTMGQHIELVDGRTIDWTKTLGNIVTANADLKASGNETWMAMKSSIDTYGIPGLEAVEAGIQLLEEAHHPLAETIRKSFEDYKAKLQESGKYVEYLGTTEEKRSKARETFAEKEKKDLQETSEEIGYKAEKYGILDEVQNKSIETQETIIKYYEDEIKAGAELVAKLQEMAMARGMSAEKVTESIPELVKYIETHKLERITIDEIAASYAKEIDSRSQASKAMGLQEATANVLLSKMKETIHVTGMSGEGLMKYVDIIYDAARANEIAADSVGLWYGELGKGQAVQEATRDKLIEFAELHDVKVPKAIKNGSVAAFQEYVDEVMNIALKTDEAMQMVQDAIDEGVNHLSSTFGKISSDAGKAFSEGTKEFNKFLKETGLDPDNPLVLQGIVDMIMNDANFDDDFTGFTENLASKLGDLKGATKGEITNMVKDWNSTISSEMSDNPEAVAAIQKQSDDIIKTMNTILNSGQGVKPVEAFVAAVGEVLGKDDAVKMAEQMGIRIPPALAAKLKAGAGAITSGTKEGIYNPLDKVLSDGSKLAQTGGNTIANEVGKGLEQGRPMVTQNATLMVDAITGEIKEVPPQAEQELKPVEGIFSQAFIDASNAAGTQLQTMVTKLHTAMSSMSTSVKTYSDSMAVNFGLGFLQKSADAISLFTPALTTLQQTFSTLSTSVMTYATSMKENLGIFVDESTIKLTELTDFVFGTVQLTFSNLSMNLLTYTTSMGENLVIFTDNAILKLTELSDYILNILQFNFSNLSTSVATYMTSMGTNIDTFSQNSVKSLTTLSNFVFGTVQKTFSNLSTSLATYTKSMGANLTKFTSDGTKALGDLTTKGVKVAHTGFQNMSTSVATYSKSMTSNITSFVSTSIKQLAGLSATAIGVGSNMGKMASQIKSAMSQASSAIKSFSSAAVSALKKVESAAKSATSALNAMAAAARKAKSAASGLRYGGMMVTGGALDMSASYAQTGKSWVNTRPRKIGGVNISEFGKPELVQVTPLSNPSDPMDRAIDYTKVPGSKMENIPRKVETPNGFSANGRTGGVGGEGAQIRGDLYITVKTQSGKVLAQEIQPYMLEGYSNITS